MENYKEMYIKLFDAISEAIETLQSAQKEVEEMLVDADADECGQE